MMVRAALQLAAALIVGYILTRVYTRVYLQTTAPDCGPTQALVSGLRHGDVMVTPVCVEVAR